MKNGGCIFEAPPASTLHAPLSTTLLVGISTIFFPVFLGFPFRLFLGGMEVCQCSLRKVAACSAGGLSLPFFTSPSYQPAFPQLFVVRFRMQS